MLLARLRPRRGALGRRRRFSSIAALGSVRATGRGANYNLHDTIVTVGKRYFGTSASLPSDSLGYNVTIKYSDGVTFVRQPLYSLTFLSELSPSRSSPDSSSRMSRSDEISSLGLIGRLLLQDDP